MRRRHHRIFTLTHVVLVSATIASFGGCSRGTPKAATADTSGAQSIADSKPAPKRVDLEKPVVRLETSLGPITIQLDGVHAPGTVRNFLDYANDRFYDNTLIHYVDPGKMIVAGGYSVDGAPKSARIPIRNEAHNGVKNTRGTIAMTRDPSSVDSATSQFFINLTDAPQRDHAGDSADQYGYCVFGNVTDGLDLAEKISHAPTAHRAGDLVQIPDPPIIVKSVRLVR